MAVLELNTWNGRETWTIAMSCFESGRLKVSIKRILEKKQSKSTISRLLRAKNASDIRHEDDADAQRVFSTDKDFEWPGDPEANYQAFMSEMDALKHQCHIDYKSPAVLRSAYMKLNRCGQKQHVYQAFLDELKALSVSGALIIHHKDIDAMFTAIADKFAHVCDFWVFHNDYRDELMTLRSEGILTFDIMKCVEVTQFGQDGIYVACNWKNPDFIRISEQTIIKGYVFVVPYVSFSLSKIQKPAWMQ